MTDRAKWDLAVAAVAEEFSLLPAVRTSLVAEMAGEVKACKAEMHAVIARPGAGSVCAACGGECCRTGKYHFTVVDLLVYLSEGKALFLPRFEQALCPFLGDNGCLMTPPYRPFTCVTFNCDRVEALLGLSEKARLTCLEQEIRRCYGRFEELFRNRFMGGLLNNCDRDVLQKGEAILRGKE